ncbi:MAG: hypothetical protein SPK28_03130 [Bacilli bacterium]|nr:hypothetical protein [Bacilli bacterium]
MKKYIIPLGSIIKYVIALFLLIIAAVDIMLWKTIFVSIVMIVLSVFFILFGLKIIILKDNSIYVSSDFLLGWYKVQYQEEILLDNLSFVEIKQRDYTYSSRGKEKTGRGIETRIVGNKFIEFNYSNNSIKRIYCLDLSKKQINRIMEFCKQKNIECK